MPFSVMAALILIIAVLSGSMDRTLASIGVRRPLAAAFFLCTLLLGGRVIAFSTEFRLALAAAAALAAGTALLVRSKPSKKRIAAILAACFASAIPVQLVSLALEGDGAAIASALLTSSLLLIFFKRTEHILFACCFAPLASELLALLTRFAALGYGYFELTGKAADGQLLSLMFAAFMLELGHFRRSAARKKRLGAGASA